MELTFVFLKGAITVKLGLIKVTLNCWNRWICNSVLMMMTPKHQQRVIKVSYLGRGLSKTNWRKYKRDDV